MTSIQVGDVVVTSKTHKSGYVKGVVRDIHRVWSGKYLLLVEPTNGAHARWVNRRGCKITHL